MEKENTNIKKALSGVERLVAEVGDYCRDNDIASGLVSVKVEGDRLVMEIRPEVGESHTEVLEGMMEDFESRLVDAVFGNEDQSEVV